jgi:F0F1-type ATP synthase delta subunit
MPERVYRTCKEHIRVFESAFVRSVKFSSKTTTHEKVRFFRNHYQDILFGFSIHFMQLIAQDDTITCLDNAIDNCSVLPIILQFKKFASISSKKDFWKKYPPFVNFHNIFEKIPLEAYSKCFSNI